MVKFTVVVCCCHLDLYTQNRLFDFLETYNSTYLIPSQNNSTLFKNQNSSEHVKSAEKPEASLTHVGLAHQQKSFHHKKMTPCYALNARVSPPPVPDATEMTDRL